MNFFWYVILGIKLRAFTQRYNPSPFKISLCMCVCETVLLSLCVAQAGLELVILLPQSPEVLTLQVCTTTPGLKCLFLMFVHNDCFILACAVIACLHLLYMS